MTTDPLDPYFDEDGKLTTSFGATDAARAVDVQEDKILVAGYTHNGTNSDFALTRYYGEGYTTAPKSSR